MAWWEAKVAEIYRRVPDFAGFLVKAGAEGMPGPEQSGAKASAGANMLGRLLAPHGGIVMWRTFTWDDNHPDPVQRQSIRFAPQDADFDRGNVFLQSVLLGVTQMAISFTVNAAIVLAAGGIAAFFATRA